MLKILRERHNPPMKRLLTLLLLHSVLMLVILLALAMQLGGLTHLYGTGWFIMLIILSVLGGAILGLVLMQFVLLRPLNMTKSDLRNYSAIFLILVGGAFQTFLWLEALIGTVHLKYMGGLMLVIFWGIGRQMAVHLLPPDKWEILPHTELADEEQS